MKMRNVLLLCLMAVLATHTGMSADILSSGNTANIPEAGVPQELARWRKATYTDVRYRLHFDIPGERTERVGGRITVSLRLEAPADIVLDFREPASSVHEVSINGIKTFMTSIGKSEMQTNGTRGESSWADGERISRADGETRGADGETNSTDRETGRTNGETSGANGEISQVTENNGRTAGDVGSANVQGNRTGKDRQPQPCCIIQNEHIVIPAALTKAGENTVDIVFTAGDQSLNRNDEFLYTLLVPDRARTLFPCFDQPDMKALYTLSLEVPMTWKAVSNTHITKEHLIYTGWTDIQKYELTNGQPGNRPNTKNQDSNSPGNHDQPGERHAKKIPGSNSPTENNQVNNDRTGNRPDDYNQTNRPGDYGPDNQPHNRPYTQNLPPTDTPAAGQPSSRKLITFSETEPLSTYLFSFVAGEFFQKDYDDGRHRFSAYYRETDTAKTAQLDDIFAQVAASLEWLEEYTGVPYPFAKYDFIILPGFQYGGMEHTGATLYNDGRMFLGPNPTLSDELARTELIAHETAHMWFGDLVTMKWFDEVWTKEVFANHFAAWISEPLYPEVNHRLNRLRSFNTAALSEDRTEGTVSISQELPNLRYAGLVYGQIIYNKAPVMMEKLIEIMGCDVFREGIQTYLKRYAYSNATWDDLVGILDSLTTADLRGFSRAWVYEKGMPDITFRISGSRKDSLTVTQTDPIGRGIVWPQSFGVTVSDGTQSAQIEVRMDAAEVTVPISMSATANTAPLYILPNTDGRGYGRFILPKTSADWLLAHWSGIKDGTARFATLMNLQENYLAGLISARDWSRSILAGLETETDQLTASSLSGFLGWAIDDLSGTDREAVEQQLWTLAHTHPEKAVRTILMRSLPGRIYSDDLCDSLYSIWAGQSEPLYSESNYTSLAWELALRFPDRAEDILKTQRARLTDPDRLRRFDYISRALSPDESARDTLFHSLMKAENRRIEPWTASVLSYLNHPLRESSSIRYIRPGLDILEEVQRTGDIFFPRNWTGALLGSHRSPEAMLEVRQFLEDHPDYPALLRNKILQAAYPLLRANTTASIRTSPEDTLIYRRTMEKLLPLSDRPAGEIMKAAAEALYGTPYAGGTLEGDPEVLTVNLRKTDCILLVEACTAMTLLLKDNDAKGIPPFKDFCSMLRTLRYRDGITAGYPSRLHYTSEWLLQAQDNGFLREVTAELGGTPLHQEFSFMSSHRDNYPRLREDDGALGLIRRAEERLDTAATYFSIPSEKIPEIEDNIQDGDIICFLSTTPGLDITHTGIACRGKDGSLHFIHASMKEGKVVFEQKTLAEYARNGIRIARVLCM